MISRKLILYSSGVPGVSIIIPVFNEEEALPKTLAMAMGQKNLKEVIVVDGGSKDRSLEIAERGGARIVVAGKAERAFQLNTGAAEAASDLLLFLHADTLLPPGGLTRVERAMNYPGTAGGGFARQFQSRSLVLRCSCWCAEVRNRVIGWHLGDQAMFCWRKHFEAIGGFPPFKPFEDLEFSRRLGKRGRIVTLRPPVISSARRFDRLGPWRTTWRDFMLTLSYLRRPEGFTEAGAKAA